MLFPATQTGATRPFPKPHSKHYSNDDISSSSTIFHKPRSMQQQDEFSINYVNEADIATYQRILEDDNDGSSTSDNERISAFTDFMPINQKTKKKNKGRKNSNTGAADGFTYYLLRWPLMLFIFTIMGIELIMYVWLRQIVNFWEYFITWRGKRHQLRKVLRASQSYEEWCEAAKQMDTYMKRDTWKETIPFGYYDHNLLQKVNRNLRTFRSGPEADANALKDILLACVKSNFAGVENARLYSHCYLGTKQLVQDFVEEVTCSIDHILKSPELPVEEKRAFFKSVGKNYGRTALCLSGGASFGYYHTGVVKALLEQGLLPSVITGTSAGGLIAATVCCRTDEELKTVLVPDLYQILTACGDPMSVWIPRFLRTGARFDAIDWARKVQWITRGSTTFREAYERTGRVLNISVIPYDPHSPSKLLNYISAPDCVIWTALIASAAVPGILNPVILMQKTKTGKLVPFNFGHKWKDGSLRTDIPLQALHSTFNVNYTIVSQVNPHVHIFFYANRGTVGRPVSHLSGRGWRGGFLASSIEQFLKLDLTKWMKVLRDLELLPKALDQDWSWVFLQRFEGNVTIIPKSVPSDFYHILSDPTYERMQRFIHIGMFQTWPKIQMIKNRVKIENAIMAGRSEVRKLKGLGGGVDRIRSEEEQSPASAADIHNEESKKRREFREQFMDSNVKGEVMGETAQMGEEIEEFEEDDDEEGEVEETPADSEPEPEGKIPGEMF